MDKRARDVPSHHLIYGHLKDFVTGERLVDTDDERYRQKIARFLVEKKGWDKSDIEPRLKIETLFSGNFVVSKVDSLVRYKGTPFMIIRYGPGSIVTRERPAIAAARVLLDDLRIPIAVVTNGQDAEVLETSKGKKIGEGLHAIPSKEEAPKLLERYPPEPFDPKKRERELRILNAYDVEVCCAGGPCPLPGAVEG